MATFPRLSRHSGRSPGRARSARPAPAPRRRAVGERPSPAPRACRRPVIRIWMTDGRAQHRRGQRQPRLRLARRRDLEQRPARPAPAPPRAPARPGKSEAVCMSAPIPRTSTSIGSTACDPRRASEPISGSCRGTKSRPPAAAVAHQGLADQAGCSTAGSTPDTMPLVGGHDARRRSQSGPPRRARCRNGPGVVPPGTASVARPLRGMRGAELVGDQLGKVAHQRVAVRIGLPRDLDHAAISRQRWPSAPVSL